MLAKKLVYGWENKMPHNYQGNILYSVLGILMLLSLSAAYISHQQVQLVRANQWHDVALRTAWAADMALSQAALKPQAFPGGSIQWGQIDTWLESALPVWRVFSHAWHDIHASGVEVHVIMESLPKHGLFRFNALAYHPSGTLFKKQWVVSCQKEQCVQLSGRVI